MRRRSAARPASAPRPTSGVTAARRPPAPARTGAARPTPPNPAGSPREASAPMPTPTPPPCRPSPATRSGEAPRAPPARRRPGQRQHQPDGGRQERPRPGAIAAVGEGGPDQRYRQHGPGRAVQELRRGAPERRQSLSPSTTRPPAPLRLPLPRGLDTAACRSTAITNPFPRRPFLARSRPAREPSLPAPATRRYADAGGRRPTRPRRAPVVLRPRKPNKKPVASPRGSLRYPGCGEPVPKHG